MTERFVVVASNTSFPVPDDEVEALAHALFDVVGSYGVSLKSLRCRTPPGCGVNFDLHFDMGEVESFEEFMDWLVPFTFKQPARWVERNRF